jgi:hypothetical protein
MKNRPNKKYLLRLSKKWFFDSLAISPQLENSLRWYDMDMIAISKTLAACKVLAPSVRFNLISVRG